MHSPPPDALSGRHRAWLRGPRPMALAGSVTGPIAGLLLAAAALAQPGAGTPVAAPQAASQPTPARDGVAASADAPARAAAVTAAASALREPPPAHRQVHRLQWNASAATTGKAPEPQAAPAWLLGLIEMLNDGSRVLVYGLGIVLVAVSLVGLRHAVQLRSLNRRRRTRPGVSHVGDLDVRPDSLPGDVGAAAWSSWRDGDASTALSLLYRAALSRLIHRHAIAIDASTTEGEALALANQVDRPATRTYFSRLVAARESHVYGGRTLPLEQGQALCFAFAAAFDTPTSGADALGAGAGGGRGMTRRWPVRVGLAAVILAVGAWIASHLSWVQVTEPVPPSRRAPAANPYGALQAILRATGTALVVRTGLEPLPPPAATLVLDSMFWDVFPERDVHLQEWVARGGHLVIPASLLDNEAARLRWVPVLRVAALDDDAPAAEAAPPAESSAPAGEAPGHPWACSDAVEATGLAPAFERGRRYRTCIAPHRARSLRPAGSTAARWRLDDAQGTLALRMPFGSGSVTVVAGALPTADRRILLVDHALLMSALVQARAGGTVWLIATEAREPLARWLWRHARAPLLLGMAATALAAWRLAVRFGPRRPGVAPPRRSMGEQVRGTGEFIANVDPSALHAATKRALDEAAQGRMPGWRTTADDDKAPALAARIGPRAGVDEASLRAAWNVPPQVGRAAALDAIATLEKARRALRRHPDESPPAEPGRPPERP